MMAEKIISRTREAFDYHGKDSVVDIGDQQHAGGILPMASCHHECQAGGRPDTQMSLIVHPQCLAGIHVFDFVIDCASGYCD